jgi:hypothetical protein
MKVTKMRKRRRKKVKRKMPPLITSIKREKETKAKVADMELPEQREEINQRNANRIKLS